jgi:hypothetical protein
MLADINHDGITEVIVLTKDGKLNVLGPDDSPTNGWPLQIGPPSSISDGQNWVSGSAAVADLDGDGTLWILQTGFDGNLHALNGAAQERAGFPIHMGSYSTDTPTVADLDFDGHPEIICRYNPGSIGVWSRFGQMLPGWPSRLRTPAGRDDVWSSPVTYLDFGKRPRDRGRRYAGLC